MRASIPLLLALGLLLPAFPAASSTTASTSFYWEAPDAYTGPLAVGATFDFGEDNTCDFRTVSSGSSAPSAIHTWEEWSTWGSGAFYSTFTTHGHVTEPVPGVSVDSREVRGRSGLWSIESISSGSWSGVVTYTHVNFAARSWDAFSGHVLPFVLDVQCEKPFTVGGFLRGDEAIAFTPDSLKGDFGAGVTQLFGSATVIQGGAVGATFTGEEVRFRAQSNIWGGHTQGEVRLAGPGVADAWDLTATDSDVASDYLRIAEAYGPGAYEVELDYLSVGLDETFLGVLYSLSPVATLDG